MSRGLAERGNPDFLNDIICVVAVADEVPDDSLEERGVDEERFRAGIGRLGAHGKKVAAPIESGSARSHGVDGYGQGVRQWALNQFQLPRHLTKELRGTAEASMNERTDKVVVRLLVLSTGLQCLVLLGLVWLAIQRDLQSGATVSSDRAAEVAASARTQAVSPPAAAREPPAARARSSPGQPWRQSEGPGPIPRALLDEHLALCRASGADSCLVIAGDQILSEWYGPRYREPVAAMSSTKSITALLVGMLVDDGRLDLDDPVAKYVPEWREGVRGKVLVRHLLSHTSGLPNYKGPDKSVGFASDKNQHVIGLSPIDEPGTTFAYSNEGCQLLSPVLDAAAGMPIQEYAMDRLFRPLGLEQTRFRLDGAGHAWTYADMMTTPRDFACFGRLMLHGGRWGATQVVSSDWVERCIAASQPFQSDCGLLWWLYESPRGFGTRGYLNTDMYVFPEAQLIVVRTQAKPAQNASSSYRPSALRLFSRMLESLGGNSQELETASQSAASLATAAMEANRRGDWHGALEQAGEALRSDSLSAHERAEALYSKMYALVRLGSGEEARATGAELAELRSRAPGLVDTLLERARRVLSGTGERGR